MKIEDGIDMLELPIFLLGTDRTIYPTLINDNDNVILVDAGISDSLKDIKSIPNEIPEVKVFVHEEDKPYIQGEKKILRLNSKFMDRINSLPNEEQKKVLDMFENSSVKVNIILNDGEELAYCGGIIFIHTPGNTPGHVCLYHKMSKTLIVGDVLNVINGQLIRPNQDSMNEEDAKIAINSLKKLEKYDIENLISYHGGLFSNKPNERIKDLIKG